VKTGTKLAAVEFPGASGTAALAAADEKTVVVASRGKSGNTDVMKLSVVDYTTGKQGEVFDTIPFRPGDDVPLVFDATRSRLAVGGVFGRDGAPGVRVYEWPRGRTLHTFVGHTLGITAMAFSPDGKTLATGSQDTTVLLWDVSDAK
jgi:WD40 repeat protein